MGTHAFLGLIVLVVAPSGAFGMGIGQPSSFPGAAGNHAAVQAFPGGGGGGVFGRSGEQESWGLPQVREGGEGVQWCAGCLPTGGMEGRSDLWGNERRRDFQAQPLQLQPDGQYRFSYSGGDSSRQEQRNLDGSVVGSYAFTDPEGQNVRVEYRASPNQGFSAFPTFGGREGSPVGGASPYASSAGPASQFVLPSPPQETPEVQAARAQFFRAYDQQLQLVKASQEAAKAAAANQVVAVYSENAKEGQGQQGQGEVPKRGGQEDEQAKRPFDFKNLPEPIAVPDGNAVQAAEVVDEDEELDNKDAIVISADDEDSGSIPRPSNLAKRPVIPQGGQQSLRQPQVQGQQQQPLPLVQPSYAFSTVVGGQPIFSQQPQQPQWASQGPQAQNIQGQQSNVLGLQNFPAIPGQLQQQQQQQPQWAPQGPQGQSTQAQQPQWAPQGPQGQQGQQSNVLGLQNFPAIPAQLQQQQQQQPQSSVRGGLEPYFYYVSVGGQPHYVSSNNYMRSDFPTSLKAQQVGAAPIGAMHNAQIPFNAKESQTLSRSSPPLYLDFDPSKTFQQSKEGGVPGVIYGFVPSQQTGQQGNNAPFAPQGETLSQQSQLSSGGQNRPPFVGYPLYYVNN